MNSLNRIITVTTTTTTAQQPRKKEHTIIEKKNTHANHWMQILLQQYAIIKCGKENRRRMNKKKMREKTQLG